MNKGLLAVLNESERQLVLQTDKPELAKLDEDGLIELHDRVRRARNKVAGQYRRGGASKVAAKGGRGKASEQNQRGRDKVEAFEDALSRVSTALAAAARRSAAELREQRLAAARATKAPSASAPTGRSRKAAAPAAPSKRTRSDASAVRKKNASTLAAGARRQAKRDSR